MNDAELLSPASSRTSVNSDARLGLLTWSALCVFTVAGLILRLQKAWEDMTTLVVNTVPDDSFYYFQIARNIMHGHGSTLDGETVTNGFHPLWMAAILPFFAIDDRHLSVHLALSLGAVLGALTIPLIFDVLRRLTGSGLAGLLGAGFFAFHPAMATYAVNGLETSIAVFTLASFCWLFVVMARAEKPTSMRWYVALGVVGALMALARVDTALVFIAVVGYLAFRDWRGSRGWRGAAAACVSAFVIVAPWLIWSWAAVGSPMQDSAVAGGTVFRDLYIAENGDALGTRIQHGWDETRHTLFTNLPKQFLVPLYDRVLPFWIAIGAILGLIAVAPTKRRSRTLAAFGLLSVPLAGLLVALLYESGIRWFVRTWYFAPYALFAAYGVGLVAFWAEGGVLDVRDWLARQNATAKLARTIPAWVIVGATYSVLALALVARYGPQKESADLYGYPWQRDLPGLATWVGENTDEDARIAAYNAGIPAYFWNRTVVNLDGVVNRDAYEALHDCDTRSYIREKEIDYVIDSGGQLFLTNCALSLEQDLEQIAAFGEDWRIQVIVATPRDE